MEGVTSPPLVEGSTKSSYLSPLMISMVGITVTAVAIVFYHFLLVKYCARRQVSPTAAAQPQPTGVDDEILKTIPIVAFSAVKCNQLEECVVCLGELEEEDMVRLLPNCKHAFHVACIDQWFAEHQSCPLCRSSIHEQITAAQSLDPRSNEQPPPPPRTIGLLRRCASLVLPPTPATERRSLSRLKRSLSMDRSLIVVINLQGNNILNDVSSSSPGDGSLTHLDRASSKWIRSLSRLRMVGGSNGAILPY